MGERAQSVNRYRDERDLLRQHLVPVVAERFGSNSKIISIERTPARYISSYPCEIVTTCLASGERFKLLLKNFGSSRRTKDAPLSRREREVRVYRELLRDADLGTPLYHGSVWSETDDRFWLLLELVDGLVVQHGDTDHERLAAAWLARLQAHFVGQADRLSKCEFLIRHDANYYRSKSEAATSNAGRISAVAASRLERIVSDYDQAVSLMTAQPLTLVHGAYIPWHILADTACRPTRVCVVDWELSAHGSTLYDLAFFTDELPLAERRPIWDAYRAAAMQHRVPVPDERDLARIVDCFRIHRIFDWLSRSVEKQFSEKKVLRLTDQAERLSTRILA